MAWSNQFYDPQGLDGNWTNVGGRRRRRRGGRLRKKQRDRSEGLRVGTLNV